MTLLYVLVEWRFTQSETTGPLIRLVVGCTELQ